MTPHKCPVCNGTGTVYGVGDTTASTYQCPACKGTCLVWEKEIPKDDALDEGETK